MRLTSAARRTQTPAAPTGRCTAHCPPFRQPTPSPTPLPHVIVSIAPLSLPATDAGTQTHEIRRGTGAGRVSSLITTLLSQPCRTTPRPTNGVLAGWQRHLRYILQLKGPFTCTVSAVQQLLAEHHAFQEKTGPSGSQLCKNYRAAAGHTTKAELFTDIIHVLVA